MLALPSEVFRFDFKSKTDENSTNTPETKIELKLEARLAASSLTRFDNNIISVPTIKEARRYFFPVIFKDDVWLFNMNTLVILRLN